MNIFLLFISMFIMIGYYIMSSPSQNVVQQETEYVIQQSDIRSIVECLVSTQNAVMYCNEFKDECVARYGIESSYVLINQEGTVTSSGNMASWCENPLNLDSNTSQSIFIISTTSPEIFTKTPQNELMDILEKNYSDRGTLGIIQDSKLIVPDSTVARDIPEGVINAMNGLMDNGSVENRLAYIMQSATGGLVEPEPNPDDPTQLICPSGMTAVFRFGRWRCVPIDPLVYCQEKTAWDVSAQACLPTEEFQCDEDETIVEVDGMWGCLEPEADIDCNGDMAVLNDETMTWECVHVEDPETVADKCSTKGYLFSDSEVKNPTKTLKVRTVSCGKCEKPTVNEDTCEVYCIPDTSKLNTRSCFSGDPTCCVGTTKGIYFGFTKKSRVDGLVDENGKPVDIDLNDVLDDYHKQNKKFNCMQCEGSVIDTSSQVYPFVAKCVDGDGQTVSATRTDSSSDCSYEPVTEEDDDILSQYDELLNPVKPDTQDLTSSSDPKLDDGEKPKDSIPKDEEDKPKGTILKP